MILVQDILIPANTLASNPVKQVFRLDRGLIYQIDIQFPTGCAGLVNIWLQWGGMQIYPSLSGNYFRGDGEVISFQDTRWLLSEPYEFLICGYSAGTTYDHRIQVRIGIADKDEYISRFIPSISFEKMLALIDQRKNEAIAESNLLSEYLE
jgi:hypothetical protein